MKFVLYITFIFLFTTVIIAQDKRSITTGVPFLSVTADARAAGLGDQGVATSTDVYSQQWNPAKYAFASDKQGISFSYTPYLTGFTNDIALGQVSYYNKLDSRSAFASSFRYFSIGNIELRQDFNSPINIIKPSEFAFDGSYALKLSEAFSMGIGARFISSNLGLTTDGQSLSAAKSFAFDVAAFYQSEETFYQNFNGRWRAGINFQNLGPKIKYDLSDSNTGSNFLPATLRIGAGFDFLFDEQNTLTLTTELSKFLVPTPQIPIATPAQDLNNDGDTNDPGEAADDGKLAANNKYNRIGWVSGIFQSFGDAPGGLKEEMQEINYSLSAEYTFQEAFAFRLGYFNQSPEKGALKFFSLGAGFKYEKIKIDVSYLFSGSKVRNPLENTLRFSLSYYFGEKYINN